GPQAAELVLGRAGGAVPGRDGGALPGGGLPPVPHAVLADPQAAGHFGHGEALVGDHPQGLELELAGVGLAGHRCTPPSECTPLTPTPRTLGKLRPSSRAAGGPITMLVAGADTAAPRK